MKSLVAVKKSKIKNRFYHNQSSLSYIKKWLSVFLSLILILTFSFTGKATENGANETTEHPDTTEYPNDPSREPDIVSNAAIVMDASTGQVLYEKNSDVGKYPASITKVITVLIALEHDLDMDKKVKMSENAIFGIDRTSTNIGLDVGEEVTIRDLMYATMVNSANECAYQLAEIVGGDVETFADMMNKKAQELGCKHTHFVTPNGLHDDNHYTTAYDMALIMQAAIKNDKFRQIAGTVSYTVPATNLTDETRPLWTGTKMINPANPNYYEYCEGGKNGYTTNANNTLVTYAKKDGLELICVVLDCDGQKYTFSDSKALYNYCYNNFMYFYPLSDFSFSNGAVDNSAKADDDFLLDNYYNSLNHNMINLTVDKNYRLLLKKSVDTTKITKEIHLFDSVEGNVLGEITFYYNGEQIGETSITNGNPSLSSIMSTTEEVQEEKGLPVPFNNPLILIAIIIAALVVITFIGIHIQNFIVERKKDERRRKYTSLEKKRRKNHRRKDKDFFI